MELFMKNRDFDKWLSTMNDSIATWKYYTDFEKVYKNAEKSFQRSSGAGQQQKRSGCGTAADDNRRNAAEKISL